MYKKYLEKTSLKRLFFIMFLWFFIVPVADKSINVMANYVFKEQGYIYSKLVAGLDKSYANYNVEDVSKELHMLLSEEFDNNKELSSIVDKEKLLNQDFNKNIDVLSALFIEEYDSTIINRRVRLFFRMILVPVMLLFILVYINYMSYTDLAIDKYNNGDNNL